MKNLSRYFAVRTTLGAFLAGLLTLGLTVAAFGQQTTLVTTGNTDGKLGALSRRPAANKVETETADDFVLKQPTVISGATIVGLLTSGAQVGDINGVEVEFYHIFPDDSVQPPSGKVPSRGNSPSDVEIDSATRDSAARTIRFTPAVLDSTFTAQNSVVNGINPKPLNVTHGEEAVTGVEVEIAITFTTPVILPAGHYFFRPEVAVNNGDFLFLSAPKPIVAPGVAIPGDLQAWIRNSRLAPDWLRIGTDIIAGNPPTFNMTFSLIGTPLNNPGIPGNANCHGKTISGLAEQFGSVASAAQSLGFSSVQSLQQTFGGFCEE